MSAENGIKTGDGTEVGLFIPLPKELATGCPSLAPHDNSDPHVTFLYVGTVPVEREGEFLRVAQEVFATLSNVHASLGKTDYFVHFDSNQSIAHMRVLFDQDMANVRRQLRLSLQKEGFAVEDSHPLDYHPHVTLAYLEGTEQTYSGSRPYGGWTCDSIEVWGLPQEHVIRFGVSSQRVASTWRVVAKYQKKIKDEDGNTHYEYGPRQVAERHKEKAKKVEKLRKSISELRERVLSDLKGKDEKTRLLALVVALIDATYERVGNEESAKGGHFGVTGWQARHLKVTGDTATFTYVGKSGVHQKKRVEDSRILSVLKKVSEGKSGEDSLMTYGKDQVGITSKDVNEYLSEFGVTAKDLRGFHANREMTERLKTLRKKGPSLPRGRKEKDAILKEEFEKALSETADAVGHEAATLRSEYLVPGLEDDFLHDGTILDTFQKKGTKTQNQLEDAEAERLVRPSPKKKPPRKDKRRNQVHLTDPDLDQGDRGDDKDLSLNYKRVGFEKNRQSTSYNQTHIGESVGHGEGLPPMCSQPAVHWRRDMPQKMTKKGAQQVVAELDRLASVMQENWEAMGVPKKAALDLAYRCDLLSDYIEKSAGLQPSVKNEGFDPTEIAAEGPGALESNKDETYTKENFTGQEYSELRKKQEAGKLPLADKSASTHGFDLFAS